MRFSTRPKIARFELTSACNLRCKMCGIWKSEPKTQLGLGLFEDLLQQRCMGGIRLMSMTGGEPFLMDDLHLYHGLARRYRPAAHINISTNGYFTKRTIAFLQRVDQRNMSITISYDGIRSHDSIRGVEGSAERLLETAQAIRDAFRGVALSLKMTVTNENHAEILETALQCMTYGIPFRFKTLEKLKCHQSRLPSEIQGPCYSLEVIESMTNQAREVLKLRIRTNGRYIKKLIRMHTGKTVKPNCFADAVFIAIDGQVFICRKKDAIGSVFRDSLDRIWQSAARKELLREMKACRMAPDCLSFTNE